MSDTDALKDVFRATSKRVERRERRAAKTRAQALSPMRILFRVILIPVTTIALTVSIYLRTSPYERSDAIRHLAAMAGCEATRAVGLAPAFRGGIGYHERNDPDGDGVACGSAPGDATQPFFAAPAFGAPATPPEAPGVPPRMFGGAKFVKPN